MALLGKKDGGVRAGLFIFGGVMQYVVLSKLSEWSYRLEECVDLPYNMGSSTELFSNQEVVEDNLKNLKKTIGNKWVDRVYAGIQSKDVLLRTVELPAMSIEDIRDSFKYEFDRFFPIPAEDSVYDITFVERPSGDDSTQGAIVHCLAAAVRNTTVENFMAAAQKTGLKLSGIEPAPVAMLRCLMGPNPPMSGFNIYALAGIASSVIVATYKDNGIVYRNTTQAFAAEDPEGRTIANFTRDLQATVNFASTQMRGFAAEKVCIGGYGALYGNTLISSVQEVVSVPIELVNPWELWTIGNQPKQAYGWEVALGLALRQTEVK